MQPPEPDQPLFSDVIPDASMSIAEIVKAFENVSQPGEVFDLFKNTFPPEDPIDQQLVRFKVVEVLKRFKIPVRVFDDWLRIKAMERATAGVTFPDHPAWPDPVDGVQLLADIEAYITRFVSAPQETILAAALWSMWTHVYDLFDIAPLLVITSPTRGCGKSTLLRMVSCICARPHITSSVTGPVIFRIIEKYRPTVLIDEADNLSNFSDDLKGLLNAGHERMTAYATRTVGDNFDVKTFSTWSPKGFSAIGGLPDTIQDRAVVVRMQKKRWDVELEHARVRRLRASGDPLARRCVRWAEDNAVVIRAAEEPDLPDLMSDRAADNWAPLIVIAEMCGARDRAVKAAKVLLGEGVMSVDELLLSHIREGFSGRVRVSTRDLLEALVARDDGPWAKWWGADVADGGKAGLKRASAALAYRLKKFDPTLKATQKQDEGDRDRGYDRSQFVEIWSRYLPPVEVSSVGDVQKDEHLLEAPQTLHTLPTLHTPEDLVHQEGPVSSGNVETPKVHKVPKVSKPLISTDPQPGDIIRVDAHKALRFRVKAVNDGAVECWQLEAGVAFKQRSFHPEDVHIVQRADQGRSRPWRTSENRAG